MLFRQRANAVKYLFALLHRGIAPHATLKGGSSRFDSQAHFCGICFIKLTDHFLGGRVDHRQPIRITAWINKDAIDKAGDFLLNRETFNYHFA